MLFVQCSPLCSSGHGFTPRTPRFHPAESHGEDWAAVASAAGGQLQAGGDAELPRHRGCGQDSAGGVRRLRSGR